MSIIRALLAVGLALGLSTQPTAAEPTCSILDVSIADPESPSPLELRQVEAAARTAIAAQHVKHADAFPAQSEGVVGMMKGGGLKTVGYSKHGHANEPKTFPDCLDACYDDCKCLGFHWSGKHARCGLKADGNIPVLVDNRYQKTFRSFKRLEVTDCTPASTTAGTTTAEPTTTTSATSTTTPATTTSTTSTTTEEPTTVTVPCANTCSYTDSTTHFFTRVRGYFADAEKKCAINCFNTSAVTNMQTTFMNKNDFNQNINGWGTGAVKTMQTMFYNAAAFNQNINNWNTSAVATMKSTFYDALAFNGNISNWNTGAVTIMQYMFNDATAFNQNINNWAIGAVTDMYGMFSGALAFNQNINNWAIGAVYINMGSMFKQAAAFNQNINGWVFTIVPETYDMFTGADLMTDAQKPDFTV